MSLRWRRVATVGILAALGDAALLAINDPGVFSGSGSPWSTALVAALGYAALVLSAVLMLSSSGSRHRR